MPVAEQVGFNEAVKEIKEGRRKIEEEFVGVVG
jgi:hypothetical protein